MKKLLVLGVALSSFCGAPALAADLPTKAPIYKADASPSGWSFQVTPYAWLTALDGVSTVRGRSTDVDVTLSDLFNIIGHSKIPKDLFTLAMFLEARNGRWSLFSDIYYANIAGSGGVTRSRGSDNLGGSLGVSLGARFKMAIAEFAAAYEVARWGSGAGSTGFNTSQPYTAFDVYGGARVWWQRIEANFNVVGTLNLGDLQIVGGRAIAASGDISWVDPIVGARIRHVFAPGKELVLNGDVGGFGAGSKFSWQAIGAYNWDFAVTKNTVWSGMVGYKALYVNYTQGSGNQLYAFDILQHGPIVGVNVRF